MLENKQLAEFTN